MASHSLSHEFRNRVEEQKEDGLTCEGHSASFYPLTTIQGYWTLDKIRTFSRHFRISTRSDVIRDQYLLVFSILVDISLEYDWSLQYFDLFVTHSLNDATLPWIATPRDFQGDARIDKLLEAFREAQWRFCPVVINYRKPLSDTRISRRYIFPFVDEQPLGDTRLNRDADMCSMKVQSRAYHGSTGGEQSPSRVVLKTYPHHLQASYDRERKAYAALNSRSPNIVRCLGSYHWLSQNKQRTSVLILEHAEKGTLLDLFETGRCPYEPGDIFAMWKGLLDMIKGLEAIHKQEGLKAIHQDLKPSNILVFPAQNSSSEFSYLFKISDFGDCSLQYEDRPANGHDAIDSRTTRTYGPPELHLGEAIRYTVDTTTDMWAVGCVLAEAAVWMSFGELGREDFREQRIQEIQKLPNLVSTGRVDCFHDGAAVLKAVRDIPEKIRLTGRKGDNISQQVVELVLENLLRDKDIRIEASNLHARIGKVVYDQERITTPPLEGSPQGNRDFGSPVNTSRSPSSARTRTSYSALPEPLVTDSPPPRTSLPSSNTWHTALPYQPPITSSPVDESSSSPYPYLSIGSFEKWRHARKPLADLSGWEAAKTQLRDRDFKLIIDNSPSMQRYKDDVITFAHHLSYLIKHFDTNGLEVYMTHDPRLNQTFTKSTDVENFVHGYFRRGRLTCNIRHVLEQAFADVYRNLPQLSPSRKRSFLRDKVLPGKVKPFSIIILTDGVWDNSSDGLSGADRPIEQCIKMMKEHNVNETDVAIQFLRFGNDARGKRRLEVLDDELKTRPHNAGYDIVDHKSCSASIWDILVGSVSHKIDTID